MLAYCGLNCESCPIHLATLETDISKKVELRVSIAEQLSKIYGTTPKPEIITDCDGCNTTNGRFFTGCVDCVIRNCARSKNLANCAYCNEFTCDKLEKHYAFDPSSRDQLVEIRKTIIQSNDN